MTRKRILYSFNHQWAARAGCFKQLIRRHPFRANDVFVQFSFWKNFADASFMPNLALKQIFAQIAQRTPLPLRPVSWCFKQGFNLGYLDQAIAAQLDSIEQHLSKHAWLAGGSFSIADILLWFPLQACAAAHPEFMQYPHCRHYLAQIESRPAFQQALLKGQWSDAQFKQYWAKAW